jgi:hypothetical protein
MVINRESTRFAPLGIFRQSTPVLKSQAHEPKFLMYRFWTVAAFVG